MRDAPAGTTDWAGAPRRRWRAARIAAALLLHLAVLTLLKLAVDRVELPRHDRERSTRLVTVALEPTPMPARLPSARAPSQRLAAARAPARRAHEAQAIAPPVPVQLVPVPVPPQSPGAPAAAVLAATPPASAPRVDRWLLDGAATRQAIRDVARGRTLAGRGNELTQEDQGSELVAADGSHTGAHRNLPPPPPAARLALGIAAAHKADCMKGGFAGAGMGLLGAPFLLAAEAMGKCAHKL